MYDMIVIGAGPAALAAAFVARGKRLNAVMVFEELGGKVGWRQTLVGPDRDAYLPGNELVQLLARRTTNTDGGMIHDQVMGVGGGDPVFQVTTKTHGILEAPVVIVATGATPIELDVPGAHALVDRGLEYSAATYAHLAVNTRVAVVGGNSRALNGAAELAQTAAQVYLVAPSINQRGSILAAALKAHPRVEVLQGYRVTEVIGTDQVQGLVVAQNEQTRSLEVDRIFVSLGVRPNSALVEHLADLDPRGFILVDEFFETAVPGLFAVGDVTIRFGEQVLAAVGDGARAGLHAYQRLLARALRLSAPQPAEVDQEHAQGSV